MIRLVTGAPGSGKTFTVVHIIFTEYLFETNRPIYTNLPINLDGFFRAYNVPLGKQEQYRERVTFAQDKYAPAYGENEDGTRYLLERPAIIDKRNGGRVIAPENEYHQIKEFWRFGSAGTVYLIDEMGKYASALNYHGRPDELATYLSQHRHYKDECYFICQKLSQVDKQIRNQIEFRYVAQRSTSIEMINTGWFRMKFPWLFFRLAEVIADPMAERDFKGGELGGIWNVYPNKKKYGAYDSYSTGDGLDGKRKAEDIEGDDQRAAEKNRKKALKRNMPILFVLGLICVFIYMGCKTYYDAFFTTKEKKLAPVVERAPVAREASPVAVASLDMNLVQNLPPPPPPVPEIYSLENQGLTDEEVEKIFNGAAFLYGSKIIVMGEAVKIAQELDKENLESHQNYARFLIVRFRDWKGIDFQTIQRASVVVTQDGAKLRFGLDYQVKSVPLNYEIVSMLDCLLVAGRPVMIENGKVLREDQQQAADNGRVFTSGKIEEEVGLKFEFVPLAYPDPRTVSGRVVIDDTLGDTLDETGKARLETWVELKPDLRLVGSVSRSFVQEDRRAIIPFTDSVPLLGRLRYRTSAVNQELMAVYAQHFPGEPQGAADVPRFKSLAEVMAAGSFVGENAFQDLIEESRVMDLQSDPGTLPGNR